MDLTAKDFMPIPISDFTAGVNVPVDLFVRIGDEKFVQVAKASTFTNVEQFKNYQNKEVTYLYVRKKDYYKITNQAVSMAGVAVSKRDLDDRQRTTLVTAAARSVFRQLDHLGFELEAYGSTKQVCDAVVTLSETHKSFADLLQSLSKFSDTVLAHSMAVSALSTMIGVAMGINKKTTLEKLAMGGMLHDIGLKALPTELVQKPLAAMTGEEMQAYETHSFKGMQMLLSLGIIPDDIVSIVYEHHENSIGQGYPQRMRDVKMHPLAKIVGLADAYADLILPNVNCPVPKNPREALMYIEYTQGVPYNKECFRALSKLIEGGEKKVA